MKVKQGEKSKRPDPKEGTRFLMRVSPSDVGGEEARAFIDYKDEFKKDKRRHVWCGPADADDKFLEYEGLAHRVALRRQPGCRPPRHLHRSRPLDDGREAPARLPWWPVDVERIRLLPSQAVTYLPAGSTAQGVRRAGTLAGLFVLVVYACRDTRILRDRRDRHGLSQYAIDLGIQE